MKELKKLLNKTTKRMDDLIEKGNQDIKSALAEIEAANDTASEIENKIKTASESFNPDLVVEFNHELNDSMIKLRILESKLDHQRNKSLIEFSEYRDIIISIYDLLDRLRLENLEHLKTALDECIEEMNEYYNGVKEANTLLKRLYKDVYRVGAGKDCDPSTVSRMTPCYLSSIENTFNDFVSLRNGHYFNEYITGNGGRSIFERDICEGKATPPEPEEPEPIFGFTDTSQPEAKPEEPKERPTLEFKAGSTQGGIPAHVPGYNTTVTF